MPKHRLQSNGGHHSWPLGCFFIPFLRDIRQSCISGSFFFMERNCGMTPATGCSFLVEIVFHVLQIMQLSPPSLDIGPSFRGRLMEVRSVLAHCMNRESVTRFQCVQCIGKNTIYNQSHHAFIICRGLV